MDFFAKITARIGRSRGDTYRVLMKSGNSFVIDRVLNINITYQRDGGEITALRLTQHDSATHTLFVASIILSQIEGIIKIPPLRRGVTA